MVEPRECNICKELYTPLKKRETTQITCGSKHCTREQRQLTYHARREATLGKGSGEGYNKKGHIKEKYLVRGNISSTGTGTCFEGGSYD